MPIVVVCPNPECGVRLTVEDDRAGDLIECPIPWCDAKVRIPAAAPHPSASSPRTPTPSIPHSVPAIPSKLTPPGPPLPPDPFPSHPAPTPPTPTMPSERYREVESNPLWRDPAKLGLVVGGLSGFLALIFLFGVALLVARGSFSVFLIGVIVISFGLAVIIARLAIQLSAAKHRAISGRRVTLFFGLARLVTWEQNEGLIFLRDKRIAEQIYGPNSGGGLRIIYPFLGEELRGRVPLTLQLTWFRDERVLTRESVQLTIRIALWWQVCDLEKYFYKIDSEVHAILDTGIPGEGIATSSRPTPRGRLGIAEIWLLTLAESCLRTLLSGTSTFLIVSKHVASRLHVEENHWPRPRSLSDRSGSDDLMPATPDLIAEKVKSELQPRVTDYGLWVDRVEVQELQLPPNIQEAVDSVWIASTLPAKSEYEAQAQRNRLAALCDLLGPQAAAMSEIVKALPDGAFVGNPLAPLQTVLASLGSMASGYAPPAAGVLLPGLAPKEPVHPGGP
jgi:regulator of protease activity HflC (stomatin/prohibitin superfamily)